jgi:hypothetical protein
MSLAYFGLARSLWLGGLSPQLLNFLGPATFQCVFYHLRNTVGITLDVELQLNVIDAIRAIRRAGLLNFSLI